MELSYIKALPEGGFNFDNCIRNTAMAANSQMSQPIKTMKTGTTICGVIFKVGIHLTHLKNESRTEWCSLLIPVPPVAALWETRTARRSTTLPPTSSAAVPVPLLIATTLLVSGLISSEKTG